MKARFYTTCVYIPSNKVSELEECMDMALEISRDTFVKNTDTADRVRIEAHLGYDKSFPISKDHHVRYYSSKMYGRRTYIMVWSAIEHVFLRPQR